MVTLLGLVLLSGCLYFNNYVLNAESEMDAKSNEEQKKELLTKEEFEDLPEVIALKEQVEEVKNDAEGTSDENGTSINNTEQLNSKPSQSDIENNLKHKLTALQNEYNGKLGGILATAKKEYNQIKSGQNNVSKKDLAQKYINKAEGLEAQCDARVYAAIAYAENELAKYGYKSTVIEQARKVYQQTKKERRKQLLSNM